MKRTFFLPALFLLLLAGCTPETGPMDPNPIPTSPPPAAGWWRPTPGLTWQWQLDEEVDTSVEAQVYAIDLHAPQETIDALHARGVKVICYISVVAGAD